MFKTYKSQSPAGFALNLTQQIFHATVRSVRQKHRSPIMCLLSEMAQSIMLVAAFILFFQVLGLRSAALRGDFVIYIMSGISLFMTHNKAVSAVAGAEGPTSAMMQHAPMNTVITISSAALGSLYLQTVSMLFILLIYYVVFTPRLVYGLCCRAFIFCNSTLGANVYKHIENYVPARKYDCFRQNVCRQFVAA